MQSGPQRTPDDPQQERVDQPSAQQPAAPSGDPLVDNHFPTRVGHDSGHSLIRDVLSRLVRQSANSASEAGSHEVTLAQYIREVRSFLREVQTLPSRAFLLAFGSALGDSLSDIMGFAARMQRNGLQTHLDEYAGRNMPLAYELGALDTNTEVCAKYGAVPREALLAEHILGTEPVPDDIPFVVGLLSTLKQEFPTAENLDIEEFRPSALGTKLSYAMLTRGDVLEAGSNPKTMGEIAGDTLLHQADPATLLQLTQPPFKSLTWSHWATLIVNDPYLTVDDVRSIRDGIAVLAERFGFQPEVLLGTLLDGWTIVRASGNTLEQIGIRKFMAMANGEFPGMEALRFTPLHKLVDGIFDCSNSTGFSPPAVFDVVTKLVFSAAEKLDSSVPTSGRLTPATLLPIAEAGNLAQLRRQIERTRQLEMAADPNFRRQHPKEPHFLDFTEALTLAAQLYGFKGDTRKSDGAEQRALRTLNENWKDLLQGSFRERIETASLLVELEAQGAGKDLVSLANQVLTDWNELRAHGFRVAIKDLGYYYRQALEVQSRFRLSPEHFGQFVRKLGGTPRGYASRKGALSLEAAGVLCALVLEPLHRNRGEYTGESGRDKRVRHATVLIERFAATGLLPALNSEHFSAVPLGGVTPAMVRRACTISLLSKSRDGRHFSTEELEAFFVRTGLTQGVTSTSGDLKGQPPSRLDVLFDSQLLHVLTRAAPNSAFLGLFSVMGQQFPSPNGSYPYNALASLFQPLLHVQTSVAGPLEMLKDRFRQIREEAQYGLAARAALGQSVSAIAQAAEVLRECFRGVLRPVPTLSEGDLRIAELYFEAFGIDPSPQLFFMFYRAVAPSDSIAARHISGLFARSGLPELNSVRELRERLGASVDSDEGRRALAEVFSKEMTERRRALYLQQRRYPMRFEAPIEGHPAMWNLLLHAIGNPTPEHSPRKESLPEGSQPFFAEIERIFEALPPGAEREIARGDLVRTLLNGMLLSGLDSFRSPAPVPQELSVMRLFGKSAPQRLSLKSLSSAKITPALEMRAEELVSGVERLLVHNPWQGESGALAELVTTLSDELKARAREAIDGARSEEERHKRFVMSGHLTLLAENVSEIDSSTQLLEFWREHGLAKRLTGATAIDAAIGDWLMSIVPPHVVLSSGKGGNETGPSLAVRLRRLDELRVGVHTEWRRKTLANEKCLDTAKRLIERVFGRGEIARLSGIFAGAETGEIFETIETYGSLAFEFNMMGVICDTCVTESAPPRSQRGNMLFFPFANPDAPLHQPILYGGTGVIAVQVGRQRCLILRGMNPSEALLERATAESIVEAQADYIWECAEQCGFDLLLAPIENANEYVLSNRGPVRSYVRQHYPGLSAQVPDAPQIGEIVEVGPCPAARFNNLDITPSCVVLRRRGENQ